MSEEGDTNEKSADTMNVEAEEMKTDILPPVILPDCQKLYEQNEDMTG